MSLPYDTDVAVQALADSDPSMARLIARAGTFTLELRPIQSPFQALFRSIIYQQLSGKAAGTIYGRVLDLFPGEDHPDPDEIRDISFDDLRGAGMSRAKVIAVKDLADKTMEGTIPSMKVLYEMDDAEIIARLTTVRGIGKWTVEMLLIFYLGRPDVLPITDLGIRKGFMRTYAQEALPAPRELEAFGERWKPYRSVASWYLWRATDLNL